MGVHACDWWTLLVWRRRRRERICKSWSIFLVDYCSTTISLIWQNSKVRLVAAKLLCYNITTKCERWYQLMVTSLGNHAWTDCDTGKTWNYVKNQPQPNFREKGISFSEISYPWTLVPIGARCWIWEGFAGFCQITFSAALVARLFYGNCSNPAPDPNPQILHSPLFQHITVLLKFPTFLAYIFWWYHFSGASALLWKIATVFNFSEGIAVTWLHGNAIMPKKNVVTLDPCSKKISSGLSLILEIEIRSLRVVFNLITSKMEFGLWWGQILWRTEQKMIPVSK